MTRYTLDAAEADQEIREALRGVPDHAYELPDERMWLASAEQEDHNEQT